MKKVLLIIATVVMTVASASAEFNIGYKGFVEMGGGPLIADGNGYGDSGASFNLATSHGVELFNGLFLGAGIDLTCYFYNEEYSSRYDYYTELEAGFLGAAFLDVRYRFLRERKVSPFVGTRIGSGYQSMDEASLLYFSPSVGCSFNFTKRFGMDVGIAYKLYNSTIDEDYYYGVNSTYNASYNNITFSVGLHF